MKAAHIAIPLALPLVALLLVTYDLACTLVFGAILPTTSYVALSALIVGTLVVLARPLGPRAMSLTGLGFASLLGTLYFVPFAPRKAFVRDVQTVSLGMLRTEVHTRMERWSRSYLFSPHQKFGGFDAIEMYRTDFGEGVLNYDRAVIRFDADTVTAVELHLDWTP